MIFKFQILVLIVTSAHTLGQTTSTDPFLSNLSALIPTYNPIYLFDGPSTISNAQTTPTTTVKPTLQQMMYYNYYTAAANCLSFMAPLTCTDCQKIKGDIKKYKVVSNDLYGTAAIVALSVKRREIVVAYRATENLMNILLDVTFINATPDGQIKIHAGFYIALMSLYLEVVDAVVCLRLQYPSYKIVITGHSLGAAMARLSEFFFISLNQFPGAAIEVYTFGEPRSGNSYYAIFLNSLSITTARIVNGADIVPHLPPTSVLATTIVSDYYIHTQLEYWINGTIGQSFCDPSECEDKNCSDSQDPLYNPLDHLTYFDVNHLQCIGDAVVALPTTVEALGDLPALPVTVPLPLNCSDDFIAN